MRTLTITRPDDWHLHLRDNQALTTTVPDAARCFGRGIIMPNLVPPVTSVEQASAYRDRILAQRPEGSDWDPLMVIYLTDNTSADDIRAIADSGFVKAVKYYPAGATTNSDSGVTDLRRVYNAFEAMQEAGIPLLLHGEVTDSNIDIFDREAVFIDRHLRGIVDTFSGLKVVLEHITTKQGAEFVAAAGDNVAATITPQHLLYNRNHMLAGGIRPHFYCLPILKRDIHQQALLKAATSGSPKFFLGTDSAPHAQHRKETACGCAGCYSNHAAIELYAEAFDGAGALDKLEGFASYHGPDFYGLPRNSDTITLVNESWQLPESVALGEEEMIPLAAGTTLNWKMV
ncbi:dihydroorotase [Porticoccaceae bacterium LTM1]|nr:dihydroorotase [Porticoccaceae bacterium LTM1]